MLVKTGRIMRTMKPHYRRFVSEVGYLDLALTYLC